MPENPLKIDPWKPLFVAHDTEDGFVYLRAEKRGRKWFARNWGHEHDGGQECQTMAEANDSLVKLFRVMFPEHRCTERCQVDPSYEGRR